MSLSPSAILALLLLLLLAAPQAQAFQPAQEVQAGVLARVGEILGGATVLRVEEHPEFERITVRLSDGQELPVEVTSARAEGDAVCTQDGFALQPRYELLPGGQPLPAAQAPVAALCQRLRERAQDLDIQVLPHVQRIEGLDTQPDGAPVGTAPVIMDAGEPLLSTYLPVEGSSAWRPLSALLLALLGACGLALLGPVRRAVRALPAVTWADLALVGLVGAAARLLLSPRGLQIFPDAGYESLVMAWGMDEVHPLYGDGMAALHAELQRRSHWDPAALVDLHLLLSILAPPLLWLVARLALRSRMALRDRLAALLTGLGLALLPVALRLAGSEVPHVPLQTFELLAVAAGLGFWSTGASSLALVAALAGAFFPQLRPEAIPMALVPLGLLLAGAWRHRGRAPASVLTSLVAVGCAVGVGIAVVARVRGLPVGEGSGPLNLRAYLGLAFWRDALLPIVGPLDHRRGVFQVFLDLHMTPVVLPLLALWGLVQGLRQRGARPVLAGCLLWWGLSVLPVLTKSWPLMDAWRLQLPGQSPLLLLAGLGLRELPRGRGRLGAVGPLLALALLPLTALPLLGAVRARWAGQVQWDFAPQALAQLPEGARVLYPDHEVHAGKGAQVAAMLARRAGVRRVRWLSMGHFGADPHPGPDLFAWEDLSCRIATLPSRHIANDVQVNTCLQLAARCQLSPFAVTTLPDLGDVDQELVDPPVQIGLYRVDGCDLPDSD